MTGLSTSFVLAICLVNVNSQSCCSHKMVGPIEYKLIGGSTDGYPMCKPGCVYEDISNPGEPFCFEAGGDLEVKCLDLSNETAITSPEGEITSPEGEITSPESEITSPEGEITSPEGEITSPEGEITSEPPPTSPD